jgi:hypothetical protein
MIEIITNCRACKGTNLESRFTLGQQYFSGYFPELDEDINQLRNQLEIVECKDCSLIQLKSTFDPELMYGENYGYRSGLNLSMCDHLSNKARQLQREYSITEGSKILDIGANDGTFLKNFRENHVLFAVDPTLNNWLKFYDFNVKLIAKNFDKNILKDLGANKFDLITSLSVFYDISNPIEFVQTIENLLSENGIWHLEQSYAVTMIKNLNFDTICHEHLEYYTVRSIEKILAQSNLKIIKIELNDINGGSFALDVCKKNSIRYVEDTAVENFRKNEKIFFNENIWVEFNSRFEKFKKSFKDLLNEYKRKGYKISCLGASTKGNVLLQALELDNKIIDQIGEVNLSKLGKVTPGTKIKIVKEDALPYGDDQIRVVLPWHFKTHFLRTQQEFINKGGILVFPLPEIQIITNHV